MASSTIKSDSAGYTLLNSYIHYAKRNGIVLVKINNGNNLSLTKNGVSLGTLPAGCRPYQQQDFSGNSLGGTQVIFFRVETSGEVKGYSSSDTVYWGGTFTFIAS